MKSQRNRITNNKVKIDLSLCVPEMFCMIVTVYIVYVKIFLYLGRLCGSEKLYFGEFGSSYDRKGILFFSNVV